MVLWICGLAKSRERLKNISTTTVSIATKFVRRVTYLEMILPIKSHGSWVTWSWEIMWQIKNVFQLPRTLSTSNSVESWFDWPSGAFTHYVIWTFKHVVKWGHFASHELRKFSRHCGTRDTMILGCHVTWQNHVIEELCYFIGRSPWR